MSTTIRFPIFKTDLTSAIPLGKITLNRRLLFFMAAVVCIVQGKFLQGREMTFDPIQPGGIRRRPVELDLVCSHVTQNLRLQMKRRIVQYYMQYLIAAVSSTQPLEKCQKGHPVLMSRNGKMEFICLIEGSEQKTSKLLFRNNSVAISPKYRDTTGLLKQDRGDSTKEFRPTTSWI